MRTNQRFPAPLAAAFAPPRGRKSASGARPALAATTWRMDAIGRVGAEFFGSAILSAARIGAPGPMSAAARSAGYFVNARFQPQDLAANARRLRAFGATDASLYMATFWRSP
jgi:hypothetical protein